MRESEAKHFQPLDKLSGLLFSDMGQRLHLNPLGKVVDRDYQKFSLTDSQWKRIENIYSPLSEGL